MTVCGCSNDAETAGQRNTLRIALGLNAMMFIVEVTAGILSHSSGLTAELEALDHSPKLGTHLFSGLFEARVFNGLHGSDWVNRGDFSTRGIYPLYDDVAGQHGPHLVLKLQCLISKRRIASAQNEIIAEIDANFLLHCRLHIDLGKHTEALLSERIDHSGYCLFHSGVERLGEVVGHRLLAATMVAVCGASHSMLEVGHNGPYVLLGQDPLKGRHGRADRRPAFFDGPV